MEGDNRLNDWWDWEQAKKVPDCSGPACDSFRRFNEDLDLAKSLGHNAHRFSLEWSRIEPEPGKFSEEAFRHYEELIRGCRARGLEPVMTLYHFTLPRWVAAGGGWTSDRTVRLFARYAKAVAERLGGQVRWWNTINEPTSIVFQGFMEGKWPPGKKNDLLGGMLVLRRLIRAHRAAYRIIHEAARRRGGPKPMVSVAHHMIVYSACDPKSGWHRAAQKIRNVLANRWFLNGSRGALDYIGLNYYTRDYVHWAGPLSPMGRVCSLECHVNDGPRNTLGWEIFPEGVGRLLRELKRYGLPVLITENGICTDDDSVRSAFIEQHLNEIRRAMQEGVPVIGYLHWSLLDNFEWAEGYKPRFGLVEVDYRTQQRKVRPSALRYSELMRGGA